MRAKALTPKPVSRTRTASDGMLPLSIGSQSSIVKKKEGGRREVGKDLPGGGVQLKDPVPHRLHTDLTAMYFAAVRTRALHAIRLSPSPPPTLLIRRTDHPVAYINLCHPVPPFFL